MGAARGTAAAMASLAMPKSAATGRQYSGINVLILWGAATEHGFTGQSWLTVRHCRSVVMSARASAGPPLSMPIGLYRSRKSGARAKQVTKRRPSHSSSASQSLVLINATTCHRRSQRRRPPPPGLIEPRLEKLIKATGINFRIGGNSRLLCTSRRLCAGAATATLFRADQLASNGLA